MKNTTIRYLAVGFGFSFLLLIVSSVASYVSIDRLIDSSQAVNKNHNIALELENIVSNTKDAETGFRGYLITRDSNLLRPYNGAYERTMQSFEKVQALTSENPAQQQKLKELLPLLDQRFRLIRQGVETEVSMETGTQLIYQGRKIMEQVRFLVSEMEKEENSQLDDQNEELEQYTSSTPILVVIAAVLAMIIIVVAFVRIRNDLRKNDVLKDQLQQAADAMRQRVAIISNVAEKISAGNYTTRVEEEEKDELGGLADALNRMASQLESNFSKLETQAWIQRGVVELNDQLKGEKNPLELTGDVLAELVQYMNANLGVLYLLNDKGAYLSPAASYACKPDPKTRIALGDGLVGQVASDQEPMVLQNVPAELFRVNSGLLDGAPAAVIIFPIVFNNELQGVLEIGTMREVQDMNMEYLQTVSANMAVAINTANNRLRLHELLQETQAQSEELQVQQDELHRSNVELEMQTQKLQASEEELRVQQEELLQSNQELEEKAQLLEERNQFIQHKSRELALLNEDIELKNKELEQASKYKSEFLANMSHELRTPLNSILLLAKLLAESKELELGDDRYEYAKVIHSSGMGLLELINEILDLSKIEAGQMQLTVEEVPFADMKQDLNAMFSPLAKEKGLELQLTFDEQLPGTLQTDKLRLEQVLKNLLSNAIKFTDKGQVKLSVSLADPEKTRFINSQLQDVPVVAFRVSDTGIGIPLNMQALVFEAFKQVDGSSKRKYGGTGLGLSISREIAKLLGGEMHLKSEDDKGSIFTVYVPLRFIENATTESEPVVFPVPEIAKETAPVAVDPEPEEKPVALQPFTEFQEGQVPDDRQHITSKDKAILIIEDDIAFVKALYPFVKNSGYKVLIATRGDEGVALAKEHQPIGILLDIHLPVMDGWSVIKHLKDDAATRHIPVHTMSSEEARRKSLNMGAVDFINKPVAEQQLQHMLQRIEEVGKKSSRMLLVIEDNPKHAAALSSYFTQNGIETAVALTEKEGIQQLKTAQFDGVILDISLNEKTAYHILDKIKTDRAFEKLPVMVYTGHSITTEDEKRINRYAATSIVKKANTYEKLLNEVSIFLHLVDEHTNGHPAPTRRNKLIDRGLEGKTILIADDDERNIYSLTKVLEMQQVKVLTASNGKQALERLQQEPHIDAVLIDIMMPEMDGYETIKHIRRQQQYKYTPVIAVTAKTMPNDRNKCMEAGASDYIAKPVDINQLLSLLRVWLY